jgi:hypothetical protein
LSWERGHIHGAIPLQLLPLFAARRRRVRPFRQSTQVIRMIGQLADSVGIAPALSLASQYEPVRLLSLSAIFVETTSSHGEYPQMTEAFNIYVRILNAEDQTIWTGFLPDFTSHTLPAAILLFATGLLSPPFDESSIQAAVCRLAPNRAQFSRLR